MHPNDYVELRSRGPALYPGPPRCNYALFTMWGRAVQRRVGTVVMRSASPNRSNDVYDMYSIEKIATHRVAESERRSRQLAEMHAAGVVLDVTMRERAARVLVAMARRLDPDLRPVSTFETRRPRARAA